nr:MAG TPA: hypothetical protein [Crassvirales sp.]DAU16047.1 MAG TPA: hypothetical protein [Caudoviricetes sp.]
MKVTRYQSYYPYFRVMLLDIKSYQQNLNDTMLVILV